KRSRKDPGHINRTLTGQEPMLAKTKKWKQGKIKTAYLLTLAVFFLGAYIWRPSFAHNNTTAGQKAANAVDKAKLPDNPLATVGQVMPGVEKQEEFHPCGLFSDPRYSSMERMSLVAVLVIAVPGWLYAV